MANVEFDGLIQLNLLFEHAASWVKIKYATFHHSLWSEREEID